MLTSKQFRMDTPIAAIDAVEGKRIAIIVPAGAAIKVISPPREADNMIDVLWEGRIVTMFAIDVEERGTEIEVKRSSASSK